MPGKLKASSQRDEPARAKERKRAGAKGDRQHVRILKDANADEPDDETQYGERAAEDEHPLDTSRIKQRFKHPAEDEGFFTRDLRGRRLLAVRWRILESAHFNWLRPGSGAVGGGRVGRRLHDLNRLTADRALHDGTGEGIVRFE